MAAGETNEGLAPSEDSPCTSSGVRGVGWCGWLVMSCGTANSDCRLGEKGEMEFDWSIVALELRFEKLREKSDSFVVGVIEALGVENPRGFN